jgi:microcystin-dependent protein
MPSHEHPLYGNTWSWGGVGGCNVYAEGAIAATGTSTPSNNLSTVQGAWDKSYSVGSSQPHNNMQPYTVVNYIIATGKDTGVSVSDIVLGA